jgi:Tol biopolymer transport system component
MVVDRNELFVVQPGAGRRRLAGRLGAADDGAVWSDSGRRIAFFGRDRGRLSLYVVRPDVGGLRRVARRIADARNPLRGRNVAWSPDGRKLAVAASRDGRYRLVVVRGRGPFKLITPKTFEAYAPDWGG